MKESRKEVTVLLVEDSKEDALLFQLTLAQTGIAATLLLVPNGKAALDLLSKPEERQRLDIVFLDLKMPMISGFEVLRWIQQQNFPRPLHIVVLSGSPHEEDKVLARELGASDYVEKSIAIEDLRHRLALLANGSVCSP